MTDQPKQFAADEGGYRLAEPEPEPQSAATPPVASQGPSETTFQAASGEADEARSTADFPEEIPAVDQVWSRWGEWKEALLVMAAGIALALLIIAGKSWVATTLLSLLGLAYGAYTIVISLEVPVRVTPEQAVREFYGALGHRLPNYSRMFILLTTDGKRSKEFSDFGDFRAYWRAQVARLARSPVWLVPLEFRVEGFKCRYNGEKTLAAIRYKVRVSTRGRPESEEPMAEFDVRNLAVKGPDGQWYLNDGMLPETIA